MDQHTAGQNVALVYGSSPPYVSYPVHLGVSLSDAGFRQRPGRPQPDRPVPLAPDEIDFTVRQPLGQLLLVRSTGTTAYF